MRAPGGLSWSGWVAGKALPLAFWSLLLFSEGGAFLSKAEAMAGRGFSSAVALQLVRHALTLGFFLLVLAAYLTRMRAVAEAVGVRERVLPMIIFLAGPAGIFFLQRLRIPPRFDAAWAGVLVAVPGLCLSLWSLWHLRSSFSILAEARRPVTTGPYRFVRHPLYLGEAMTMLGLCLLLGTLTAILLWAGVNAFQLLRARIEEDKLAREFADYRIYRERTSFILPGIY